jgi:hypothetical protein
MDVSITDRGFRVGDLVLYKVASYNSMVIYRIIGITLCDGELVWSEYKHYKRSTYMSRGWVDPTTGKVVNRRLVYGHLTLIPVFSMSDMKVRRKTVPYGDVSRLKKIDILELGGMFSRLNDFVMSEAKRLSE